MNCSVFAWGGAPEASEFKKKSMEKWIINVEKSMEAGNFLKIFLNLARNFNFQIPIK